MPSTLSGAARAVAQAVLLSLVLSRGAALHAATERLFVLTDGSHIRQLKVDTQRNVMTEATYSEKELPQAFPAAKITVGGGNLLRTFNEQGAPLGLFVLEARSNRLASYAGQPGEVNSLAGRLLVETDGTANFRGPTSLYAAKVDPAFAAGVLREQFRATHGSQYRDLFVVDGLVFGVTENRIDRLSNRDGTPVKEGPEVALTLPNAKLGRATVSPWGEAFIADQGNKSVQRVVWRNGGLQSSGVLSDPAMIAPGALVFDADGELFAATGAKGPNGVLRYRFVLDNFITWRAVPHGSIDLEDAAALDLALSRPAGFVISEAVSPLVAVSAGAAGNVHNGISQTVYISPTINSETATVALVQYAPGGYTAVHKHPQMEQVEIVLEGRAIWEVGEFEREVGPGDVVFCPRNVKHGYRVIGDKPFKFYQVEWREWAIAH